MTAESNRTRINRGATQRTYYPTEVVEKYKDGLSEREFAILMLASAGDEASVALILNVPRGTVKSRLHRARKALAELLKPDGTCGLCETTAKVGELCPKCGTDTVTEARQSTVLGSD